MKTNSPEEAEIIVQKLPSDMGIHRNPRKGTLKAPDKLLEDLKLSRKVLIDEVFPDEFDLEETQKRIRKNTEDLISYGKPILSIGGDHSVSFPVLKALKEKNPDLKLIWLDSHLDLKQKVDDHISHDVVVRELLESSFSEDEVFLAGITEIDSDEKDFIQKNNLNIYRHEQIKDFLQEFKSDEQPVYLSIDIDVLKEEQAPGTGYADGKLGFEEVKKIIKEVNPDYADLVEVAPPFDQEDKTISTGKNILKELEKSL